MSFKHELGAMRWFGGINKWEENLSYTILKEIEDHWKTKMPEKKFDENSTKEKFYILSMFPYPSGQLHLGHIKVYGTSDFLARFFRMKGKNVLHPMGWDAFGLPAENAALERGVDPNEWTQKNIADMKSVMEVFNFSFDWDREFATCDSEYYKWTQYFFVKLFKMGLVYRKEAFVNWDPIDKTVLANEQIDANGRSWRSGAIVEKKLLRQWFIKTTAFSESLYKGLQNLKGSLKGWEDIVDIQKHWIGPTEGTVINFEIVNEKTEQEKETIPIWMRNPEYIDKTKFVAVKPNSYYTYNCKEKGLMEYQVKNPFTGEILPVYQTDSISFPEGSEVHIGIPEMNEQDREFADSFHIRYHPERQNLVGEKELLELRERICAEARERGIGGHPASSKLKDWLISRQRYWGTPIPIVYCKNCGEQPVPEEDLPVKLPVLRVKTKGGNALKEDDDWLNTTCPKCGGNAIRETDTMDTFVDSSWYYLRFIDPDNEETPFDVKKVQKFTPVDIYVGGKEHATLHLFYARFMNHFLHSLGLLPHQEPFSLFVAQGVVKAITYVSKSGEYVKSELVKTKDDGFYHAETNEVLTKQWEKMSKSKYNSVEPMKFVQEFGVDLMRLIILRASSPKSELNWNEDLVNDVFRWQRKLWVLVKNFIKLRSTNSNPQKETEQFKAQDFYMFDSRNFYLSRITTIIENTFEIGTALRRMQGLTNCFGKCSEDVITHSVNYERTLALQIILLAPCTPYFASELWAGFLKAPNRLCDTGEILWDRPVLDQPWPQVDADYRSISDDSGKAENNEFLNKVLKAKTNAKEKKSSNKKGKKQSRQGITDLDIKKKGEKI